MGDSAGNNRGKPTMLRGMNARPAKTAIKLLLNPRMITVTGHTR
jgi:hypothetical protein